MPHDHPGFDYWQVSDPAHPFPVGDITVLTDAEDMGQAEADLELPQAQPKPRTVAERSVGIVNSAQLWFALECTTDAQGNVACEAVLRGKHVHWFTDHGETEGGPVQELRLSMAEMVGGGRKEALAAHGPHCDLFSVQWWPRQTKVHCELTVLHIFNTVQGFIESRARANREAERLPLWPAPRPDAPAPTPTPKPEPEPIPGGAMAPGRPFGPLAKLIGFFKRLAWGLFG